MGVDQRVGRDRLVDRSAIGLLALTQSLFFASLALCVTMNDSVTARRDGISFYGVYPRTILLVVVGYAAAGLGLWNAATWLRGAGAAPSAVASARIVAVGLPLLLVTPYDRGTFFNWAHMSVGVTMALAQLAASVVLVRRRRRFDAWAVLAVQLAGGLLAAASLPDWPFPWLLQGETIYELAYGLSLFLWIRELAGSRRRGERLSRAQA